VCFFFIRTRGLAGAFEAPGIPCAPLLLRGGETVLQNLRGASRPRERGDVGPVISGAMRSIEPENLEISGSGAKRTIPEMTTL